MIKAIVFDCFGVVLADALSVIVGELEQTDTVGAQEIRSLIHATNKGVVSPTESTARVAQILGITVDEYREKVWSGEVRNEPLMDYIIELRKIYKTAMLSNITGPSLARRFPHNELGRYFDVVVASSDIGYAKPEPEAYLTVCERLGMAPGECIFTDDREEYVQGAQDVGMQAILFESFGQFRDDLTEVTKRT